LAVPADEARCAELLAEARLELLSTRGGWRLLETGVGVSDELLGAPEALGRWVALGPAPDRRLLVGAFHGEIVGLAAGTVEPGAPRPGAAGVPIGRNPLVGRVACCFVEAPARGVGVGAALFDALLAWFVACGCTDVEALALPGDRSTKQLYEANGLKARLLVLHRSLP
jgi:GNAT superfamily N-acetyltransferase